MMTKKPIERIHLIFERVSSVVYDPEHNEINIKLIIDNGPSATIEGVTGYVNPINSDDYERIMFRLVEQSKRHLVEKGLLVVPSVKR